MRYPIHLLLVLLCSSPLHAEDSALDEAERIFAALDANADGVLVADEIPAEQSRLFARQLRTSDADGDGQLTRAEFTEGLRNKRPPKPLAEKPDNRLVGADNLLLLVVMMDTNADGTIHADEVPDRLRPFHEHLSELMADGDDAGIRLRELARFAPRLARRAVAVTERLELDVDLEIAILPEKHWQLLQRLDGQGQMAAGPDMEGQIFDRLRNLDVNGNGQVELAEVPEPFVERFKGLLERADRNDDGQLSEQELDRLSRRTRRMAAAAERRRGAENREKTSEKPKRPVDAD